MKVVYDTRLTNSTGLRFSYYKMALMYYLQIRMVHTYVNSSMSHNLTKEQNTNMYIEHNLESHIYVPTT